MKKQNTQQNCDAYIMALKKSFKRLFDAIPPYN